MPDGVKLQRHRDAPPSHADIECGNRNEEEAHQVSEDRLMDPQILNQKFHG